jgi:hypothetical protein
MHLIDNPWNFPPEVIENYKKKKSDVKDFLVSKIKENLEYHLNNLTPEGYNIYNVLCQSNGEYCIIYQKIKNKEVLHG